MNSKLDKSISDARYLLKHHIFIEKLGKKYRKTQKIVSQNFPLFSPHDTFEKYLTKEVVTNHTFREYLHLLSKKWSKNIDKQRRY